MSLLLAREIGIWAAGLCFAIALHLQFNRQHEYPPQFPILYCLAGFVLLSTSLAPFMAGGTSRLVAFGGVLAIGVAVGTWMRLTSATYRYRAQE